MKYRVTWRWTRKQNSEPVKVARVDSNEETRRYYGHTHHLKTTTSHLSGTFIVEIDEQAIIDRFVSRAAHNRNGKSVVLGGLIRVKREGAAKLLSSETKDNPIPAIYSQVQKEETAWQHEQQ